MRTIIFRRVYTAALFVSLGHAIPSGQAQTILEPEQEQNSCHTDSFRKIGDTIICYNKRSVLFESRETLSKSSRSFQEAVDFATIRRLAVQGIDGEKRPEKLVFRIRKRIKDLCRLEEITCKDESGIGDTDRISIREHFLVIEAITRDAILHKLQISLGVPIKKIQAELQGVCKEIPCKK
ncbi:MAG TPA: hypothetical protein VMU07_01625 [Candidatus Paceibacterota bacterium]|nr:hypothetical protein [Candidatus Paceibacterota bacterium]